LRRVRLDAGGYDEGGAYWGRGGPLYHACEYRTDGLDYFFRARDRQHAKEVVLARYPNARFYR
jgi:hypothetical protein